MADDVTITLSDEELFARVAQGSEAAFADFYDRHATLWFSIAMKITGQEAEAEDVLQEAAVQIWERAPGYNPALGKPLSWAVTIVRNKAIDRFRASRRQAEVFQEAPEETAPTPDPNPPGSEPPLDAADAAFVRQALDRLGQEQRQAIELAFFRGLTQTEIAEHLGEPLGTVKARIRRGMLHLRDALEGAL